MENNMVKDIVKFVEQDFVRLGKNKAVPHHLILGRLAAISFKNDIARNYSWKLLKEFGNE